MSTGLYLYCLRKTSASGPAADGIKAPGVNGKEGVIIRAFDGIEAVVSEVNFDDFGEMQKKAQEDIHWIKEKALAHEMVVEEAMGLSRDVGSPSRETRDKLVYPADGVVGDRFEDLPAVLRPALQAGGHAQARPLHPFPVIPVKFGVIFNTNERLAKVISEQSNAIRAAFDRIRAKQEWSVKLFLKDNQKFKDQIREQNELFREKSNTLSALPAGMAYFMEEEFNGELERECSRMLDEEAMKTFEELKPFASEATLVKILDSKLTGRSERMILNSAYLVANIHLPEFENAVAKMRKKLVERGFLLEQGGPWPAYHFTEFANE